MCQIPLFSIVMFKKILNSCFKAPSLELIYLWLGCLREFCLNTALLKILGSSSPSSILKYVHFEICVEIRGLFEKTAYLLHDATCSENEVQQWLHSRFPYKVVSFKRWSPEVHAQVSFSSTFRWNYNTHFRFI